MELFRTIWVCVIIFIIVGNLLMVMLSRFSASYSALKNDVVRYYHLYRVSKENNDTEKMTVALNKLEDCYESYTNACHKRDDLLCLTNIFRSSYPGVFRKIDIDTEDMENVFTIFGFLS